MAACRWALCLALLGLLPGCKITPDEPDTPAATPPPRPAPAPAQEPADEPAEQAAEQPAALDPVPELPAPAADGPASGPAITVAEALEPPDPTGRAAAVDEHLAAVRAWLLRTRRGALLLSRPENYAWLTAGEDNQIAAGAPPAALAVLPARVLVVAPSDILAAARAPLRGLTIHATTYRWDLGRDPSAPVRAVGALAGTGTIAADEHRPGSEYVADEITALRQSLSAFEQQRLTWLGRAAAAAVHQAVEALAVEATEAELAGAVESALTAAGAEVLDLRVTSLDRLRRDGLAPAAEVPLGSGAAVHLVAGRWGLSATVGRTVALRPDPLVSDAYGVARSVYATLLGRVAASAPLRELFAAAAQRADELGAGGLFARVSPGAVGGYGAGSQPIAPTSVARLAAGCAVTLTVQHPRAYLAETLLLSEAGVAIVTAGEWPAPGQSVNGRLVPIPTLRGAEADVAAAEQSRAEQARRRRRFEFLERIVGRAVEQAAAL